MVSRESIFTLRDLAHERSDFMRSQYSENWKFGLGPSGFVLCIMGAGGEGEEGEGPPSPASPPKPP